MIRYPKYPKGGDSLRKILMILFLLAVGLGLLACKTETTTTTAIDTTAYEISNGGFETGDLSGWTVTSGTAFSRFGVTAAVSYGGTVPYGKDGTYLYGVFAEDLVGTMQSEPFTIGGSGYLSFKLGGGANPGLTYLSIVDAATGIEYYRFGNSAFQRTDYAVDPSGYRVENLVGYVADLSLRIGTTVRLVIVDQSTANDGYLTIDAIETYHPEIPVFSGYRAAIDVKPVFADAAGTPNILYNSDFATGTLAGWTVVGEAGSFLASHLDANHRLSNRAAETAVGMLRSGAFKVGGRGLISFRLGATKHPDLTYLSIKKVGTNEEVFRTYSDRWHEADEENTHLYYIDLSAYAGSCLYFELVDNSRGDWGLLTFEDLDTYLPDYPTLTDEIAVNLLDPFDVEPDYAQMRSFVDTLIADISDSTERLTFQKTFYSTLDGIDNSKGSWPSVVSYRANGTVFIATGDINAMWLRDSSAQVLAYLQFMTIDPDVKALVEGLLKQQFEFIRRDPYANAFNADGSAFERKFEVDSLCYPFWLAYEYYRITGDAKPFDAFFLIALDQAIETLVAEMAHSDANYAIANEYDRNAGVNAFAPGVGLIWSAYRPSDDVTYYRYNIPQNMFAAATMAKMAALIDELGLDPTIGLMAEGLATGIRQAVETYGIYDDPVYGTIYVFETDGTNTDPASATGKLRMDAANIPSLLSAPWLGWCEPDDETYLATRAFILSTDNPYYYEGTYASGIGDPHDGVGSGSNPHPDVPVPWHMAIAMQALTSTDDAEIATCVGYLLDTTAGTYVMHEAFNANDPAQYSRDHFTWPCALYAHLYLTRVLHIHLDE